MDGYLEVWGASGAELIPLAERTTIGRAEGCEVALSWDDTVSTLHAVVERYPAGHFCVRDLGSSDYLDVGLRNAIDQGFVYYLLGVALSHSHREHGPGGKIPPQFMIGAMSLTQTALAGLLGAELSDAREALRAATAWNKLLLVHLNVLLLGYMLPPARSR